MVVSTFVRHSLTWRRNWRFLVHTRLFEVPSCATPVTSALDHTHWHTPDTATAATLPRKASRGNGWSSLTRRLSLCSLHYAPYAPHHHQHSSRRISSSAQRPRLSATILVRYHTARPATRPSSKHTSQGRRPGGQSLPAGQSRRRVRTFKGAALCSASHLFHSTAAGRRGCHPFTDRLPLAAILCGMAASFAAATP